jgi:hypothetical protein
MMGSSLGVDVACAGEANVDDARADAMSRVANLIGSSGLLERTDLEWIELGHAAWASGAVCPLGPPGRGPGWDVHGGGC